VSGWAPPVQRYVPVRLRDAARTAALLSSLLFVACGGGGSSQPPPPPTSQTYTVGGSVSGLMGSGLTLVLNGSTNLPVSASGTFTFPSQLASGASYAVTVGTQPAGPVQDCTVSGGSGSIAASNVTSVAVACSTGEIAYVTGTGTSGSFTLSAYTVNLPGGTLTPLAVGPYDLTYSPVAVTPNPAGTFLYVTTLGTTIDVGTIEVFAIDATTDALTPVSGSPFATSLQLNGLVIDPAGQFGYAPVSNSGTVAVYALDATTGAPTPITGSPFACAPAGATTSVVLDAAGQHLYASYFGNQGLPAGDNENMVICAYDIDPDSGALTAVAGSPFDSGLADLNQLAIDPTGTLLFAVGASGLAEFTLADGVLTAVPGSPFSAGGNPELVAVDPVGPFLYVGDEQTPSAQIFGYSINTTTGALTQVSGSPVLNGDGPVAPLTVDPSGTLIYLNEVSSSDIIVYTVDTQTGAITTTGTPVLSSRGALGFLQQ
jgi:6-phosphogluconolactonase